MSLDGRFKCDELLAWNACYLDKGVRDDQGEDEILSLRWDIPAGSDEECKKWAVSNRSTVADQDIAHKHLTGSYAIVRVDTQPRVVKGDIEGAVLVLTAVRKCYKVFKAVDSFLSVRWTVSYNGSADEPTHTTLLALIAASYPEVSTTYAACISDTVLTYDRRDDMRFYGTGYVSALDPSIATFAHDYDYKQIKIGVSGGHTTNTHSDTSHTSLHQGLSYSNTNTNSLSNSSSVSTSNTNVQSSSTSTSNIDTNSSSNSQSSSNVSGSSNTSSNVLSSGVANTTSNTQVASTSNTASSSVSQSESNVDSKSLSNSSSRSVTNTLSNSTTDTAVASNVAGLSSGWSWSNSESNTSGTSQTNTNTTSNQSSNGWSGQIGYYIGADKTNTTTTTATESSWRFTESLKAGNINFVPTGGGGWPTHSYNLTALNMNSTVGLTYSEMQGHSWNTSDSATSGQSSSLSNTASNTNTVSNSNSDSQSNSNSASNVDSSSLSNSASNSLTNTASNSCSLANSESNSCSSSNSAANSVSNSNTTSSSNVLSSSLTNSVSNSSSNSQTTSSSQSESDSDTTQASEASSMSASNSDTKSVSSTSGQSNSQSNGWSYSVSTSINAEKTIIVWTIHIKHCMTFAAAMTFAYEAGECEPSVTHMTFGVASCYRATYTTLKSVTSTWANTASGVV